ncbi:MAG: hypothetical protein NUV70_08605 [Caldiserica bacterium]|jgi:hypothetical protein|nr:hypothetical protein [Caldisericota bacterium]
MEFKNISLSDLIAFQDTLAKAIDDRELVLQLPYNQLMAPKVSFEELCNISDSELVKIARDFSKKEPYLFSFLQDTSDEYFFTSFLESYPAFHRKTI